MHAPFGGTTGARIVARKGYANAVRARVIQPALQTARLAYDLPPIRTRSQSVARKP